MKKLLSVLVALTLLLTLAACGKSGGKQEIIVWNAGIQTTDTSGNVAKEDLPIYALIKEFETQNPDYTIKLVDYSMDDLTKAFTSANMAKSGPDMVALWAGSTTLSFQDYLVDFNEHMTEAEKAQFNVSSLLHKNSNSEEAQIGLTFGMPSTFIMYYNQEIFDANNLKVPTNWDELMTVSETLKAAGVTPMVLGDKDGYTSTWAVSSLLGNIMGPDDLANLAPGGSAKLSGPEFTEAMNAWKSYVDAGYASPDYLTKSDGDAVQDFVQGKGAMLIHGNWSSAEMEALGDKAQVARIPAISADAPFANYMVSQPNINIVVTNYSTKIEPAVAFAKMLASPEFTIKSNEALYAKPVASRLAKASDAFAAEGHNVTGFDSIISGEAANEFYKLAPSFLSGRMTLEELAGKLDELNKKA